ncbi:MAG: ShlB/FhaC/HecB family hemolysin secretion/activation protein [Spirulinaceae cyanobacterium SM2_1_0]|nr:ShlB/FhaC/HecB family hemolysin secretion/activation protein [Spirulinaceae cyanobacterium SM2_1_0]
MHHARSQASTFATARYRVTTWLLAARFPSTFALSLGTLAMLGTSARAELSIPNQASVNASDLGLPLQPLRPTVLADSLTNFQFAPESIVARQPRWVRSDEESLVPRDRPPTASLTAVVPNPDANFWADLELAATTTAPTLFDLQSEPVAIELEIEQPLAQVQDNEDRFLQPDATTPTPLEVDADAEPLQEFEFEAPEPAEPVEELPETGELQVNNLSIVGSTVFTEADFAPLVTPFIGQRVSAAALQTLADAITERYLEAGYITSRAVLAPDSLGTGDIRINILEGSIEAIEVEGLEKLNDDYVRDRVWLGAAAPLNTGRLEDQLRLLRANPVIENIEASLRTGSTAVQSLLVVRVTEAQRLYNTLSADNYSPPSVGSERLGYTFRHINLTGYGDEMRFDYRRTAPGGSDTIDFIYRRPLNPMDGTIQVRTSVNWNRVTQPPFDILDISGESQLYEISYRQPLIKTPREELAVSLGFTYQTGQTFTFAGPTPFGFGPEADGSSTTSVFKFGQDYLRRDPTGAWALRSQFSFGTGLFDATSNTGDIPDSHFSSWLAQIQRVQVLNANNFLIVSFDFQYSVDPLLPSQQFVIGGGQSVRGFRQNVRAADNGFRFSVEDRITLARDDTGNSIFILAPFFDMGWVWNANSNPNLLQNENFIAGVGLGVLWEVFPGLTLRFDYGYPIINLADRGENAQDDGIYFSVVYQF